MQTKRLFPREAVGADSGIKSKGRGVGTRTNDLDGLPCEQAKGSTNDSKAQEAEPRIDVEAVRGMLPMEVQSSDEEYAEKDQKKTSRAGKEKMVRSDEHADEKRRTIATKKARNIIEVCSSSGEEAERRDERKTRQQEKEQGRGNTGSGDDSRETKNNQQVANRATTLTQELRRRKLGKHLCRV